jgi:RNA-directed DNA polymerase
MDVCQAQQDTTIPRVVRIYRSDVLWRVWSRVRNNKGAAGVDEATLRPIEEQGVRQFLEGIQADLRNR